MVDAIDQYAVEQLKEYYRKKLVLATKEGLSGLAQARPRRRSVVLGPWCALTAMRSALFVPSRRGV